MNNPDLQTLFDSMLRLAQGTIAEGFIPTGASMDKAGEVTLSAAPFDNNEASVMLSRSLQQEAKAGTLRASGMMFDVLFKLPDGAGVADAVVFILEHEDGEGVMLHQTYKKGWLGKTTFGELFEEALPENLRAWTK